MASAARKPGSAIIRPLIASDEVRWWELWKAYCSFYGVELPTTVTAGTWTRLVGQHQSIDGFVAVHEGELAGFVHLLMQENTWSVTPVAYLEDLFVDPKARGLGVGSQLLERSIEEARNRGCSSLYWLTKQSNEVARKLYDRYASTDGMIRYRINFAPA